MRRRLFVRVKPCEHDWGGWWIDDETGIASRSCLWCHRQQFEQMARYRVLRKENK